MCESYTKILVFLQQQQASAFHDICDSIIDDITCSIHKGTHIPTTDADKKTPFILPFP